MPRPSEPVRAQQRETKIDEQARRDGKAEDQVKHRAPSHPLSGTNGQRESRENREGKEGVKKVQHGTAPSVAGWTLPGTSVRPPFEKWRYRVRNA
jgi:hypothetical protein